MPKRRTKYPRRRRPRRFRRRYRRKITRPLLTPKFCTKLRYVWTGSIDPAASGVCGVNVFRANSLYDPDLTGVGSQPRGFDQIMGLYEEFQVIGSKCTVKFASRNSSTYDNICGIMIRSNSAAETVIVNYVEQPNCRSTILDSGASANAKTVTQKYNQNKIFGTKSLDASFVGSASSNPTNMAYYHVFAAPIQAVDADAVDIMVTIDYIAVFTRPADIIQS